MFNEYTIKDVIEEVIDYRGKTPKKLGGDWSEEKTEYMALSAKNIKRGRIVQPDTIRYVDQEMYNKWMKQEVERGTILITSEAPFGELLYWDLDEKIVLSQRLFGLKIKKEFNSRYIYYYMFSEQFQGELSGRATGSTVTGLRQPELLKCHLKVPDINIQNRIAKVLSDIDKKIELNNQINDNLQKLCNQYYLYLINDKNKEVSLAELMEYQGGSQPPASEFQYISSNENVRFVQIRDFDTDSHICYIPNSNKNKICQEDDILIARYGASLGRICYGLYGAYNVALAKVLPKDDKYKELIRIILESKEFYEYINNVGQRSAQAGFNAGDIQAYKVKVPDNDNDIINYNHLAKECLNKRLLNNKENKRLEELRDTLLPKLMNGEINLDKIEI